jgi:hypothetical protein
METYIIRAGNGNQGAVTNRLQNEVASGKSVQETTDLEDSTDYLSYEGRYRALLYCLSFSSALKENEVEKETKRK